MDKQRGQTLVETLVAALILAMGISAALALATYSLNATSNIRQQIIGMGMAREGIEVVKNMRDTNWLRAVLSTDCWNFDNNTYTALCYRDWLNPSSGTGYNLTTAGVAKDYFLTLNADPSNPLMWSLNPTTTAFGLQYPNKTGNIATGLYQADPAGVPVTLSSSGFGRKITITPDTSFAPFNVSDVGPRLKITSQVWWSGKNCPKTDTPTTRPSCTVKLETYLTNWKNYSY